MSIGLRTKLLLQNPLSPRGREPERGGGADLGLPGLREQRSREKRDRIWRRVWRICMWALLLAGFFALGYNTRVNLSEAQRRAEVVQDMGWKRIAMLVPQGKRKCAMDWREGCLVCEHRTLGGTVKSTMC